MQRPSRAAKPSRAADAPPPRAAARAQSAEDWLLRFVNAPFAIVVPILLGVLAVILFGVNRWHNEYYPRYFAENPNHFAE